MYKNFLKITAALVVVSVAYLQLSTSQINAQNNTITVSPTDDTYVNTLNAGNTHGSEASIVNSNFYTDRLRTAYLKFDLPDFGDGEIVSARLEITPIESRPVNKSVYTSLGASWSEDDLNYDDSDGLTRPEPFENAGSIDTDVESGQRISIELNVEKISFFDNKTMTLILENKDGAENTLEFASKENPDSAARPRLILTTSTALPSPSPKLNDTDVTGDGKTDQKDYDLVLGRFGTNDLTADINKNGRVDLLDIALVITNMNKNTQPIVTPTPTPTPPPTHEMSGPTPEKGLSQLPAYADCDALFPNEPFKRYFLESQAWWWLSNKTDRIQTGDDFGHHHIGTCWPHAQQVSGTLPLKLRYVIHNNPGEITNAHGDFWNDGVTDAGFILNGVKGTNCPGTETCIFEYDVEVDTTKAPDGRQEMRFHIHSEQPDGNSVFPTTGWQVYLNNGNSVNNYRDNDTVISRGWYDGGNYQNTTINPLPTGPVSGNWTFKWEAKPGSEGSATTYHLLAVDFNAHAKPMYEGLVIEEGVGPFSGNTTIDTTQLGNGWHKLFIRADSDINENTVFRGEDECLILDGSFCDSTNSGVMVIWFEVRN